MESVVVPASSGTALTTGTASDGNGPLLRCWLVLVEEALRFNASGEGGEGGVVGDVGEVGEVGEVGVVGEVGEVGELGEVGEVGEEGSRRFLSLSRLFGLVRDFFPSGVVSLLSPNSSKTFDSWSAPSSS